MDEILTRQLKIYCPQHQATFEIAEGAKIVCEIKEHALSNDFPNEEFWEYCCDCQTFFPSALEVGEKVKIACPQCERKTVSRFVCSQCKIVTFDSGEDTKGKQFQLNSENFTILPACPGCLTDFSEKSLHLHKCSEIEAVFATERKNCPFCKKETAKRKPQADKSKSVLRCAECHAENKAESYFCNNCGNVLRSNPNAAKRGTTTAKTQLLGSICPTCGKGNLPTATFCGECGQALKAEKPKYIPPPPPIKDVPNVSGSTENFGTGGNVKTSIPKKSNFAGGLTAIGAIIGLVIICCACGQIFNTKKSNDLSVSSSTPYSTYTATPYRTSTPGSTSNSSSTSVLSSNFDKSYSGTISGQSFTMRLKRDGSSLKGTASTGRTDYLYGTIDNNGNFTATAYENDNNKSGIYKGKIYSDGSISGTWTNPQGGQSTSFSLSED